MKDLFGKALRNYHQAPGKQSLLTWTSLTDEDPVPLAYFFRMFEQMPALEQKALQLTFGEVLDIGCGSGSHSLYLQDTKGLDVTGIDLSKGASEVAKDRGVKQIISQSIFDYTDQKFDTLLLLMNGLGIAQTFQGVIPMLNHLKTLLKKDGQILMDSSDLIYLFPEEEQADWQMSEPYYGQVEYGIGFQNETEEFPWLYLDYDCLLQAASLCGFHCEMIMQGPNYDYLARLTVLRNS